MAEAVAAASPLMAAVNKIKDSTLHVISQVRARVTHQTPHKMRLLSTKMSFE
jgi:hypothetical protein